MEQVYEESPRMMVTTIAITVFCLSLVAFRSLLLTIRLLLTIFVTICLVFSSAILFFQYFLAQTGIYWIIPIGIFFHKIERPLIFFFS